MSDKAFKDWIKEYIKNHNSHIESNGLVRVRMKNAWHASQERILKILKEEKQKLILGHTKYEATTIDILECRIKNE